MIKNLNELKKISEKAKKDLDLRLKSKHKFIADSDQKFEKGKEK